jgi:hypothetical protein
MRTSYMPQKKADQVQWAQTFVNVVGTKGSQYGVPADLLTQFTTINTSLQTAWTVAQEPATRTRGTVAAADNLLKSMRAAAKNLVSIIQGTPSVTDQMKIDAGLTVRKTTPSKKPSPSTSPFIQVNSVDGRTVTIELRQSKSKRGRPTQVAGATVLTYTGTDVPQDPSEWRFATNTSKTTVSIPFGPSTTGDTVFITAFWIGTRGESGPAATPVSVNLPAGGVLPTAEAKRSPMRKAA